MPRTNYALPIDVVRRFKPGVTPGELDNDEYLPRSNREVILGRIEGVESDFESDTRTAFREVRVGSVGDPATYEHLEAKRGWQFPVTYTLDNRNVHPLDSSAGDKIEVRTSRDSWDDITGDEGSRWVLVDNRRGKLEFYSRLQHTVQFRVRPGVRFIRLTYRYGGLGGSATQGGQTTLGAELSVGSTPSSLSVADASRLPAEGGVMLVDGAEYVRVDGVDAANDEVSIAERGVRRTTDDTRASGSILHYCPMRVREAVAAKAAEELVRYDAFVDSLQDDNATVDPTRKLDDWEREYQDAVNRYSQWSYA